MTEEKRRQLWKIIVEAGDYLLCQRDTLSDTIWHYSALVMQII